MGGRSTSPVSGSTIAAYGFSWAPVPVISSPYVHVAAAGDVGDGDLLLRRPLASTSPSTISRSEGSISSSLPAISRICSRTRSAAFLDRLAGDEGRARRERPGAHRRRVGVRVVVRDPVVRDADRLGDDLRLDRLRPVADVGRPGEDVDAPVGLDLDPGLRRVAVLVHPRRVLDRRDPAAVWMAISGPPGCRAGRRGAREQVALRASRVICRARGCRSSCPCRPRAP